MRESCRRANDDEAVSGRRSLSVDPIPATIHGLVLASRLATATATDALIPSLPQSSFPKPTTLPSPCCSSDRRDCCFRRSPIAPSARQLLRLVPRCDVGLGLRHRHSGRTASTLMRLWAARSKTSTRQSSASQGPAHRRLCCHRRT